MEKIPTAKEYFNEELSGEPLTEESVIESLIEFAKLHVKAALEAAANKVEIHHDTHHSLSRDYEYAIESKRIWVPKNSILNAYSENLIR